MSKVKNHVHKLQKFTYKNGTSVFFCTLDCSFKIDIGLSLGKRSICHQCNNEFTINEYSIRLAKPHCRNCGKTYVKIDGKRVQVPKPHVAEIVAADIGRQEVTSLKERLAKVVTMEKDPEDI